ncbi:MAG: PAS domain S-box protein, partial [Candidatus Brocadiae bacterium]|nr:PAS domain S-box protein [Candidatus Brocadiia bacterium]
MTDSALKRDLSALIVEASEDAIVGMSLDGTIVSWNAGAVRMLGRDAGAAIGRGFALLFPGDGAADARSLLDRVRRGE